MYSIGLRIVWCCLLLCAPAIGVQGQPSISSVVDKSDILIGEQATLSISAYPNAPDQPVEFGPLPEVDMLEWGESGETDTLKNSEGVHYVRRYKITSFDSGDYSIPPVPVHFYSDSGKRTQFSDAFPLRVRSVAVDTTQAFAPIKTIVPLKFSLWDYWPGILTGIGLLLLILGLIYYLKRRRRSKPEEAPRPENAHEWAERQLKTLEAKKLWQLGQLKAYYASLSMILKMYLESRFGMPVMEQTTDDLIKICKKDKRLRGVQKELRTVLQTADLVKFAKADPGEESHWRCMQAAFDVVHKTRFLPEEKGGAHE